MNLRANQRCARSSRGGGILPKIREIDTENLGFISGRVGSVGVLAFGRGRVGRVGVSDPLRKLLLELRKHPHRPLMASSDGSALPVTHLRVYASVPFISLGGGNVGGPILSPLFPFPPFSFPSAPPPQRTDQSFICFCPQVGMGVAGPPCPQIVGIGGDPRLWLWIGRGREGSALEGRTRRLRSPQRDS